MKHQRFWILAGASALLVGGLGSATFGQAAMSQQIAQDSPSATTQSPPDGTERHHHPIDFAAAATKLGVTEAQLKAALGVPAQRPEPPHPNLAAAATKLGVTQDQLQQALGITIDPQTGKPNRPHTRPNLSAAATKLGVTEAQLKDAMGLPPGQRPPKLDIASAAAKLGVTEQQLVDALGIPAHPPTENPPN